MGTHNEGVSVGTLGVTQGHSVRQGHNKSDDGELSDAGRYTTERSQCGSVKGH